jgi:hypothetical protein
VSKWEKMMSVKKRDGGGNIVEWKWSSGAERKVLRRVYKGVPDRWRMAAWWTLAEVHVGTSRDKGKGRAKTVIDLQNEYKVSLDRCQKGWSRMRSST